MKLPVSIRAFIAYTSRFKLAFWSTALIFVFANVMITLVPWIIGRLTASLTESDGSILFWASMVILASISHDISWHLGEFAYKQFILKKTYQFDNEVFNAVVNQPYGFFADKFTGKISSYTNMLGGKFRELMDGFHFNYISYIVTLPIIIATMFTVNLYTGIVFVASLILMFFVGRPIARRMSSAERVSADALSTLDGHVVDSIANFVSFKAFNSELREVRRMVAKRQPLINAADNAFFRGIIFWATMSFIVRWVIWITTFVLNIWLFTKGEIGLAQMATFLTVIVLFSTFIWEIIWNISQVNIKIAKIAESYDYLFGDRNIFADPPRPLVKPVPVEAFKSSLGLHDVSFAYPEKPDVMVLKDLRLTIKHGEKIGLVGPSGSGKSTLTKLLLGYYEIVSGNLSLDGKTVDNRALGNLTSYVPQDTAVFHRSIAENIAYGKQGATQEQIVEAAKHAEAHEFIEELDKGYETLVGERGIKLSGGQRQRVAIARAILADAPLLILDEATSALDSESEQHIQVALWELMKGRTAIVIAHRLSTIQKMDRIIVMDKGTIVEEGSHAELLRHGGVYAKLWAHQSGGFLEE